MGQPATKIDINFLKPFIHGTVETIKVQCSQEVVVAKPGRREELVELPRIDIAGVIGISNSVFTGSIALCFPKDTFLSIMGGMLGEEFDEIGEDLEDGAGELLNIIFGYAKRELNSSGYDLEKAIPTVIRGEDLKVQHFSENPSAICPFTANGKKFFIEITFEQ